jgi:hypothetical protein
MEVVLVLPLVEVRFLEKFFFEMFEFSHGRRRW